MPQIEISVNGNRLELPPQSPISAVLEKEGYDARFVAVVVNESFVPQSQHGSLILKPGDRLEILQPFVGG